VEFTPEFKELLAVDPRHERWFNTGKKNLPQWTTIEALQHIGDPFIINLVKVAIETCGLKNVTLFSYSSEDIAANVVLALVEGDTEATAYFYYSHKWGFPMLVGREAAKKKKAAKLDPKNVAGENPN